MAQMLDLADLVGGQSKAVIINMFEEPKENISLMREQLRNLRREMEPIKKKEPNRNSITNSLTLEM